jgi:hypothetical protein
LRRAVVPHVIGEESASQIGRSFKRSRFAREEVQRPPLSATARARLEEAFAPDIEALSEMLDRDLLMTWLGRPSAPSLGASSSPGIRHTSEVATPR